MPKRVSRGVLRFHSPGKKARRYWYSILYETDLTFVDIPVDGLLSDNYTKIQRVRISSDRAIGRADANTRSFAVYV